MESRLKFAAGYPTGRSPRRATPWQAWSRIRGRKIRESTSCRPSPGRRAANRIGGGSRRFLDQAVLFIIDLSGAEDMPAGTDITQRPILVFQTQVVSDGYLCYLFPLHPFILMAPSRGLFCGDPGALQAALPARRPAFFGFFTIDPAVLIEEHAVNQLGLGGSGLTLANIPGHQPGFHGSP